jgi:glycine cleavage system aminomethyltransferase T
VMLRLDENRFWFAIADSDVLLYAKGLAARANLEVEIDEPDAWPLQIQGPDSKHVVSQLFGPSILELKYYWFREADVDGIPVIVTRTGWSAEVGYELYLLDSARGTDLWERVMEAGNAWDIRPTGPSDIRRIEGGIFNWGADFDWRNNPYEMGLERLVDLEMEGEFVAESALRRIRAQGVERRIVGIEIAGDPLSFNAAPWPVTTDRMSSGKVTSALWSPRLEKNIGYAWVPTEEAEPGAPLTVMTDAGKREATVVLMPFVDPGKHIPRS